MTGITAASFSFSHHHHHHRCHSCKIISRAASQSTFDNLEFRFSIRDGLFRRQANVQLSISVAAEQQLCAPRYRDEALKLCALDFLRLEADAHCFQQAACRFFRVSDTPNSLPKGYCAEIPSASHTYPSPIWSPHSVLDQLILRPATFDGPAYPSPILREASAFTDSRSPSPVKFLPSPLSESPHERAAASPDQKTQTLPTTTGEHSPCSVDDVTDEELYGDHTLDEELYGSVQPKAPTAELGDLDDDPRFGPAPVAPAATSNVLASLPGLFATPPTPPSAVYSSHRLIAPKPQYPFPKWAGKLPETKVCHSSFPAYKIRRHRPVRLHPDHPVPVQYEGDLPGFGTEDEPYLCDTPSPAPYPASQSPVLSRSGTTPASFTGLARISPARTSSPHVPTPSPIPLQTQDRRLSIGYILGAKRPRDDDVDEECVPDVKKPKCSVESCASPGDSTDSLRGAKRRREDDDDEEDGPECKKTKSV